MIILFLIFWTSTSFSFWHNSSPKPSPTPVQVTPSTPAAQPSNLTININNHQNNANHNQSELNATQTNNPLYDWLEDTWHTIDTKKMCTDLTSSLWEYRYYICAGTLAAIYGTLCYHFYYAQQFMRTKAVWASWRKELSLEELLAQNVKKITQELLVDIQVRYTNDKNPTDFIAPLVDFSIAIQKELEVLRWYQRTYNCCKQWHLIKPLPFHTHTLETINTQIERATYVQTLFKNWAAHHNLACQVQKSQKTRTGQGILQKTRSMLGI